MSTLHLTETELRPVHRLLRSPVSHVSFQLKVSNSNHSPRFINTVRLSNLSVSRALATIA